MRKRSKFIRVRNCSSTALVLAGCLFASSYVHAADRPTVLAPPVRPAIPPAAPGEVEETVEVAPETAAPERETTERWVREFDDRSPVVREAAVRRLLSHPSTASEPVLEAFLKGSLSTRLAALELLRQWGAPVEDLDPWHPETFTPERQAELNAWKMSEAANAAPAPKLTEERLGEVSEEIVRMLRVSDEEAEAVRERLARWGEALLPEVYKQLRTATTDLHRRRLQALRYRLVAAESLPGRWPDGLLRLASPDIAVRQKAAEQLASLATSEDQLLLRELFGDPHPLIREISLRGMRRIGGKTQEMLLDLLDDPDPNVRAAVLKQLEEKPGSEISRRVPGYVDTTQSEKKQDSPTSRRIVDYVKTEQDPDLIGHAVRVLRTLYQNDDSKAMQSLIDLLKHDRWQVRSEAAEALASTHELSSDVSAALIELLDDEDSFVVSKAVEAMEKLDSPQAVKRLVKVIERYPDLAEQVVRILLKSSKMLSKATPLLKPLRKHDDPRIRAAVIGGLDEELHGILEGAADQDSRVRIAAARSLFRQLDSLHGETLRKRKRHVPETMIALSDSTSFFSEVGQLLGSALGVGRPDRSTTEPVITQKMTVVVSGDDMIPSESENPDEPEEDETTLQEAIASASEKLSSEELDLWLRDFHTDKRRDFLSDESIKRFESMLSAESLEERVAAAMVLVPMGKKEEMVDFLLKTVTEHPEYFESFVEIVHWLERDERRELFQRWRSSAEPTNGQVVRFLRAMVVPPDLRDEPLLWDFLNEKEIAIDLVAGIFYSLKDFYLYNKFAYSQGPVLSKKIRAELVDKLLVRANSGSENQRLIAVTLLVTLDTEKAGEIAKQLDLDPSFSEQFRRDMFQIRLLAQPDRESVVKFVVETLKQNDADRSKMAFRSLLDSGRHALQMLRGRFYLSLPSEIMARFGYGNAPQLPKGLELNSIRSLLDDSDEEVAAYAGYFAVMLDEPDGMKPLLKYWQKVNVNPEEVDLDTLRLLMTRAIASLDDPQYVPILREIYAAMQEYHVREFYWTVRSMTGPEILKFRKEIRDKHGMVNLK